LMVQQPHQTQMTGGEPENGERLPASGVPVPNTRRWTGRINLAEPGARSSCSAIGDVLTGRPSRLTAGVRSRTIAVNKRIGSAMKVLLRQIGGVFGGERIVDVSDAQVRVTKRGGLISERQLTKGENARVDDVVQRLISKASSHEAAPLAGVSDSMLTEVEIGDAKGQHIYRVRSGDNAPDELWELVSTLRAMAEASPQQA
jgi:hypothetical protein